MAELTPQQQRVLTAFLRAAGRKKASPKKLKALVAAGLVEANLGNPDYGDRDSIGSLQERSHYGSRSRRLDPYQAALRFLSEAEQLDRPQYSAGQLAQAVQRSAFPGRYDQRGAEAEAILANRAKPTGRNPLDAGKVQATPPRYQRGSTNADVDGALVDELLSRARGRGGSLLKGLEYRLGTGGYTTETPGQWVDGQVRSTNAGRSAGGGTGRVAEHGTGQTDIETLLRVAARDFKLRVGEHPAFGGVAAGVHAAGGYHYRKAKRSKGAAGDLSGDPRRMAAFAAYVARNYGKDVEELIWRGNKPQTIKKGRRVPKNFYSKHEDHVHVADID